MAVERRNPLPKGRYWIDLTSAAAAGKFTDWRSRNAAAVKLRTVQRDAKTGGEFVQFDVLTPVRWEGPGLPSKGAPKTREDTIKRPAPEPGAPEGLFMMALGFWLLSKMLKRGR